MTDTEAEIRKPGVDVYQLAVGTKLLIETGNSIYEIEILGKDGEIKVVGGQHFKVPTKAIFLGSTWGGSLLKKGWIAKGMFMDIQWAAEEGLKILTTEGVTYCKITAADNKWFYEVDL